MSPVSEIVQHGDPFRTSEGSQGVFRVLLDAMARPGTIRQLPAVDGNAPIGREMGLAAIAQTLLDHEVTFATVPGSGELVDEAGPTFAAYARSVTGCREVLPPEADYVFALGGLPAGLPAKLKTGLPAYPDEGATLISLVPALDGTAGIELRLSGPGVPPGTVVTVPGWSSADLASLAAANSAPPLGIDVILVDAAGRVMCLPRSTRISVGHPPHNQTGIASNAQEVANGLHRG